MKIQHRQFPCSVKNEVCSYIMWEMEKNISHHFKIFSSAICWNQQGLFVLLCPVTFKSTLNELTDLNKDALFANLHCSSSLYSMCSSFSRPFNWCLSIYLIMKSLFHPWFQQNVQHNLYLYDLTTLIIQSVLEKLLGIV